MADLPQQLTELLGRLSFYSSVKNYEKICLSRQCMVSSGWGISSVYRYVFGESSEKLIEHTNQLITDSYNILSAEQFKQWRHHIYRYLEELNSAISRMVRTAYDDDANTKSQLKVSQTRVISILNEMSDFDKFQVQELRSQTCYNSPCSKPISIQIPVTKMDDILHTQSAPTEVFRYPQPPQENDKCNCSSDKDKEFKD